MGGGRSFDIHPIKRSTLYYKFKQPLWVRQRKLCFGHFFLVHVVPWTLAKYPTLFSDLKSFSTTYSIRMIVEPMLTITKDLLSMSACIVMQLDLFAFSLFIAAVLPTTAYKCSAMHSEGTTWHLLVFLLKWVICSLRGSRISNYGKDTKF